MKGGTLRVTRGWFHDRIGLVFVVAGLVGALPLPSAGAEDSPSLSLVAAAEAALAHHPAVAAAEARSDAARAGVAETGALRRPSLLLGGSASRYQEPLPVTPIHGFSLGNIPEFDRTLVQGHLSLRYSLYDGGGRPARIAGAEALAGAAEADLDAARQGILARVSGAFLEVLALSEELAADDARLAALAAERRRAEQFFAAGKAPRLAMFRAEAALATAAAERASRAARLTEAERELARLSGLPPEQTRAGNLRGIALAEGPLPAREELFDRGRAASPEVAAAARRLAAAEAAVALAEAVRRPGVDLVANELLFSGGGGGVIGEWNAGVQVALPLYTGGATAQRIARAQAEARGAAEALRLAELEVEARLDGLLTRLAELAARAESLATAEAALAEAVRIEALRVEAEAGTQPDFLAAISQLQAVRAARVEARHGVIGTRVELARLLGELSTGWLARSLVVEGSVEEGP